MSVHLIVYTSEYAKNNETFIQDVENITACAKATNADYDISGVLLVHDKRFLQILEGDQKDLENLMSSISNDDRHKNIEILVDEKVAQKSFAEWGMATFDLSDDAGLNNETLKIITEIYKQNFSLNGKILAEFYEKMARSVKDLRSE